jgi:bacteriorhodopsin
LYTNIGQAARTETDAIRDALKSMRTFILVGWAIYPLGYLITLLAGGVEVQVVRELVYNIADLVNKVGFGLVAVMAAKKMSDLKLHQVANAQ